MHSTAGIATDVECPRSTVDFLIIGWRLSDAYSVWPQAASAHASRAKHCNMSHVRVPRAIIAAMFGKSDHMSVDVGACVADTAILPELALPRT